MNRDEKQALAGELKTKFEKANVALFADYKGLSASDADNLRRELRGHKAEIRVLKNNVARLLTREDSVPEELRKLLDATVGPTMVAFAFGDPAATAKAFHKFSEKNEALKLKESVMGREKLEVADIEALANLPSREVLLSRLMGTMRAPVQNFVNLLAGVPRGFLTALKALEDKKRDAEGSS